MITLKILTEKVDRNSEFDFNARNMVDNFVPSLKKEGAEILMLSLAH